ncbi:hypothetical protein PsorP6_003614 [Peronosclerospora sorghi]|uniref:Uncharacterized protein n=1 Tax=Peronosclerospora sorghi TaxID=230839 RepID=A0ACC0VLB7_9STRA|nr:hypothetical protein PsorP6_003614 [Peronosclerospora sorghi]
MVVALPLIQKEFSLSTTAAESIVNILMLGELIGRKPANLITSALFFFGALFMTFAGSLRVMLIGGFVAGLAVGSSGPCFSTYVAEISQSKNRGELVTIGEIMVCFGCLVSVAVSSSLEGRSLAEDARHDTASPIVQLKYRTKEASVALKRLAHSEEASHQIIQAHLDTGSFFHAMSELVTDKLTRKRVLFCVAVAFCHIMTAANAMLYCSSYILNELQTGNDHPVSPVNKEIWVGFAKLAGVCSAVAVVDRIGRRPLLIVGTAMMLLNHFVFAVCFWSLSSTHSEVVQKIGEINLFVFIFAWNMSWSPLMWVVCSELLPDQFRSIGMGLTFGVFWLGSAVVNQTLLSVFHLFVTRNAFLLYTTLTAGSLAFALFKVPTCSCFKLNPWSDFVVPETKGLTFEQIAMLFNEKVAGEPS